MDDTSNLKQLGSNTTEYKYEEPRAEILETFPNKYPTNYVVELNFPEFTSLCPKTGQPDFASIHIEYVPDQLCVESKSLKLYFFAYRQYGSFMETITNMILADIVSACAPKHCKVTANFAPRGGVALTVVASAQKTSQVHDSSQYEASFAQPQ